MFVFSNSFIDIPFKPNIVLSFKLKIKDVRFGDSIFSFKIQGGSSKFNHLRSTSVNVQGFLVLIINCLD